MMTRLLIDKWKPLVKKDQTCKNNTQILAEDVGEFLLCRSDPGNGSIEEIVLKVVRKISSKEYQTTII